MPAAADRSFPIGAALLAAALLLASFTARSALVEDAASLERIPAAVSLDGVGKVEAFAWREGDYFWLPRDVLVRLGLLAADLEARDIGGVPHLRLDAIDGLAVAFDEATLTLALTADPRIRVGQELNLARVEDLRITQPSSMSGYLNYLFGIDRVPGAETYEARLLGNIAGGGWIARSEHQALRSGGATQHYRVESFLERDWDETMVRLRIGDFSAGAGPLASSYVLGGVSIGRAFDLRPGFVSAPTARIAGIATAPSTAEVYVDGVLVATRTLSPGPYEFRNLQDFSGLRRVEIVIRDASGVRERIQVPYYFVERLLNAGYTDFNVSWGVQREAALSDKYGDGAFSGYVLHGFTDWLTLGAAAQHSPAETYAAAVAGVRLGHLGVVGLDAAYRRNDGAGDGYGGLATWSFTHGSTTLRAIHRANHAGFIPRTPNAAAAVRRETSLGWDQSLTRSLLLSLTATERQLFSAPGPEREYAANLTVGLFGWGTLTFTGLRREVGGITTTEGAVNLSATLGERHRATAGWRRDREGGETVYADVARSQPTGQGYGWRLLAQESDTSRDFEASGILRARHGVISGSARQSRFGGQVSEGARASLEGSLACVGASCHVMQPVTDAFAIVDLAGIPGVTVTRNNEVIGRSNDRGEVFIATAPALTRNDIEIDDREVPIGVSVPRNRELLVPARGVGYRVRFDLRRISSITGRLVGPGGRAVENMEFKLLGERIDPMRLRTGRNGFFEVDHIEAGRYQVAAPLEEGPCHAWIDVPEQREMLHSIGEVRCEPVANF